MKLHDHRSSEQWEVDRLLANDPQNIAFFHDDEVKAGDKILFGKWSGTEVKVDGEDLIIMKESDILGIIG